MSTTEGQEGNGAPQTKEHQSAQEKESQKSAQSVPRASNDDDGTSGEEDNRGDGCWNHPNRICLCRGRRQVRKKRKLKKKYGKLNIPWSGMPTTYEPCVHLHFKTKTVSREELSQQEYAEMLATPKGYEWQGKPTKKALRIRRRRCRRKTRKMRRQKKQRGEAFTADFMSDMCQIMNPELQDKMVELLTCEFGMKEDEADNVVKRAKTCKCSRKKKKKPIISIRNSWIQEFSKICSDKITEYIVAMLTKKRTPRAKKIAETILRHLCDITGEQTSLHAPKTRIHRLMVLLADRLAMWLDEMFKESKKPRKHIEETEPSSEESSPEDTEPPSGETSPKPSSKKASSAKKSEVTPEEKSKEPDEEDAEPAGEPSKKESLPPKRETPPPKQETPPRESSPPQEETQPKSPPQETQPKSPPQEAQPEPPAQEDQPASPTKEDQPGSPPAEEAQPGSPAQEDQPESPTKEDQPGSPAEEAQPGSPAQEDQPEPPTEETVVPDDTETTSEPPAPEDQPEKTTKSPSEGDGDGEKEKKDEPEEEGTISPQIEEKPPKESIKKEEPEKLPSVVVVETKKPSVVVVSDEDVIHSTPGTTFAVRRGDGSYYEVSKISSLSMAEKIALARHREVPVRGWRGPKTISPVNSATVKDWALWAKDVAGVAEEWNDWIETTIRDVQRKAESVRAKEGKPKRPLTAVEKLEWEKWRQNKENELMAYRVEKQKMQNPAQMWNKKVQVKSVDLSKEEVTKVTDLSKSPESPKSPSSPKSPKLSSTPRTSIEV